MRKLLLNPQFFATKRASLSAMCTLLINSNNCLTGTTHAAASPRFAEDLALAKAGEGVPHLFEEPSYFASIGIKWSKSAAKKRL